MVVTYYVSTYDNGNGKRVHLKEEITSDNKMVAIHDILNNVAKLYCSKEKYIILTISKVNGNLVNNTVFFNFKNIYVVETLITNFGEEVFNGIHQTTLFRAQPASLYEKENNYTGSGFYFFNNNQFKFYSSSLDVSISDMEQAEDFASVAIAAKLEDGDCITYSGELDIPLSELYGEFSYLMDEFNSSEGVIGKDIDVIVTVSTYDSCVEIMFHRPSSFESFDINLLSFENMNLVEDNFYTCEAQLNESRVYGKDFKSMIVQQLA